MANRRKNCGRGFYEQLKSKIDFKAAPVSSIWHAPISFKFEKNVCEGLLVEVAHERDAYWFAHVRKRMGYFVLLRWHGAEADFKEWRNFAAYEDPEEGQIDERVHHYGWGEQQKNLIRRPPRCLKKVSLNSARLLKKETFKRFYALKRDIAELVREELQSPFRIGMKFEVTDVTRMHAMRPAILHEIIGRRLGFRSLERPQSICWFHEFDEDFRPRGWCSLIGRQLNASPEYKGSSENELQTLDGPPAEDQPRISDFKPTWVPKSVRHFLIRGLVITHHRSRTLFNERYFFPHNQLENWLKENHFEEGCVLGVIDPLRPGISFGTIEKVLRGAYLEIEIKHEREYHGQKEYRICVHASSQSLLSLDFVSRMCKQAHKIKLNPPPEELRYEKRKAVPDAALWRKSPENDFEVGQVLEVVDVFGTKRIVLGIITGIFEHLLTIHYAGWNKNEDHVISMLSPSLYPVGWSDLVPHPLITPTIKEDLTPGTNIEEAFVVR